MNTKSANSIPFNNVLRCQQRTSAGRQCRLRVSDAHSGLCPHHHLEQKQRLAADLSVALVQQSEEFQTAQGINFSLGNLYRLLAENRISSRRAAVLAYISSLLLRTHAAIDADREAGITAPNPEPAPANDSPILILPEKSLPS